MENLNIKEIEKEIDKFCKMSNKDYEAKMLEARKTLAGEFAKQWQDKNKFEDIPNEEVTALEARKKAYNDTLVAEVEKYIENMPTETLQHLRGISNMQATMFNLMNTIIINLSTLNQNFWAVNKDKIIAEEIAELNKQNKSKK